MGFGRDGRFAPVSCVGVPSIVSVWASGLLVCAIYCTLHQILATVAAATGARPHDKPVSLFCQAGLVLKRLGRFFGPPFGGRSDDKWIDVFSCGEVLQLIGLTGFDPQAASGYGWPPFPVSSNSRLVNPAAWVERVLRLERFPRISPRFLMTVRKKNRIELAQSTKSLPRRFGRPSMRVHSAPTLS